MERRYRVAPVAKAMQVLQCVGGSPEPMSLKAIANYVELPKTTVFRYLWTLRECGVVSHDAERDLYAMDIRMLSMIRLGTGLRRLREVSLPYMQSLEERFEETVNLGVLDGTDVVYIEIVESRRSLRMQARVGGRDPSYATALGKAILAFLPEQVRVDVIPPRLRKLTPQTLDNLAKLTADLDEVKRRGHAEEFGESEDGAACIGVPVFDERGEAVAGISIAGPDIRMTQARIAEIAPVLTETARKIGLTLALKREAETE